MSSEYPKIQEDILLNLPRVKLYNGYFCSTPQKGKVSGDASIMHVYEEEIQINGRDGAVVNVVASIHPEKDAQIPERVLNDLWKIIKAVNLEDAVTIASLEAATSLTMTPQLVTSRIIHVELEFYCPLYPRENVFPSESLYPGGARVIVHIRIKQVGED